MVFRAFVLHSLFVPALFLSSRASGGLPLPLASYTVPAGELLLEPESLPVPQPSVVQTGSSIRLQYQLPRELDGESPRLYTLEGIVEGQQYELEGDGLNADCVTAIESTSCTIHYDEMQINHAAADAYLLRHIQDPALVQRLQVARLALEHQAVGILTFEHP
jgi:hypothetical protein